MSTRQHFAWAAAIAAAAILTPAPASAAPPSNDTIDGAISASVGFSQVLDTTEATTDEQDTQFNETCGAPATDASVWYTVAGTGAGVVVDVSASSYSAGVMVGTGTPDNLETVACGPGTVGFLAEAGTTYYVLAFDDQEDGTGTGGSLDISFAAAPPPPTAEITVDPRGTFSSKTGIAHLSGSYTCTDADFLEVDGSVRQPVGRLAVTGSFFVFDEGTCDGTPHPWAADVEPDNGKFAGGKAMTVTFTFACGPFDCAEGFAEQTVHLSGGKK
ncbi:hypothetical protein EKO23_13585 [Nocardioides guangzhouensis]|uniref:Uncharacterized protein n=1 Tax=Nocardioides guangzhouensis TaxID=2497878 RepID=A0A4V1XZ00_9ACTN|nr:hypothetical protein [Nocardioides guangzhouensis]RYP85019.1 hypothetical protein EKO23_13585 [Nocardioides guangzhouensis]